MTRETTASSPPKSFGSKRGRGKSLFPFSYRLYRGDSGYDTITLSHPEWASPELM